MDVRSTCLVALLVGCGDPLPTCPADAQEFNRCSAAGEMCVDEGMRCDCRGERWHCADVRCPVGEYPDLPSGSCSVPSDVYCRYSQEIDCICRAGQWGCGGGVDYGMVSPPEDLSPTD
jgi:hypothetical protein